MGKKGLEQTVEHLFRNEYGKVVSLLTRKFGTANVQAIEDAVQDTFLKAMQVWGYQEVPKNPTAWLFRVANNSMIDHFRRGKKVQYECTLDNKEEGEQLKELTSENEITDSQLKLVFACCDPSLSHEYQVILSLKLMGGFNNRELAEALLKKEETVAKSYTRAKKKFREEVELVRFPVEMGLQSRLFVVLRVIYLLFSEGYSATSGSLVLKKDICYEALRLALLLRKNKYCQHPNLEALIALMCFHASRFDARLDEKGELVSLEFHDRTRYNQELIQIGTYHLENAGTEDRLPSQYHLEAAVSFYHSVAKTFQQTDWESILYLYDIRLRQLFSPMVALNRIVAFAKVHGGKQGLAELEMLTEKSDFSKVALFYAIKAELLDELGDPKFELALKRAIDLTENELVKRHLEKKLC